MKTKNNNKTQNGNVKAQCFSIQKYKQNKKQ